MALPAADQPPRRELVPGTTMVEAHDHWFRPDMVVRQKKPAPSTIAKYVKIRAGSDMKKKVELTCILSVGWPEALRLVMKVEQEKKRIAALARRRARAAERAKLRRRLCSHREHLRARVQQQPQQQQPRLFGPRLRRKVKPQQQ